MSSRSDRLEIGPQHGGDDPFTARMRLHQSWWRAEVLRVPCGVGPHATSTATYGNMLSAADGARGLNFLAPEIADYAIRRQREFARGIKKHRLLCNLLSSQPMCFNLFAPLALDETIRRPMAAAMFAPIEVADVERVIVEHEPAPRSDHLADATSFDAFVEVRNGDGDLGFIGIETKLTEPFSQDHYAIADGSAYRRWIDHEHSLWSVRSVASLEALDVNQLFRDHALALAALRRSGSPYRFGALAVVHHQADRVCTASLTTYRRLLRADADSDIALLDLTLDEIVRRLRPVARGSSWRRWLDGFECRYVDLSGSAATAGRGRYDRA